MTDLQTEDRVSTSIRESITLISFAFGVVLFYGSTSDKTPFLKSSVVIMSFSLIISAITISAHAIYRSLSATPDRSPGLVFFIGMNSIVLITMTTLVIALILHINKVRTSPNNGNWCSGKRSPQQEISRGIFSGAIEAGTSPAHILF